MFGETSLSFDHCLTSVCKLANQWQTFHYLVHPTEVLKCLKFPPQIWYHEHKVTEGLVHGVHKVVIQSSFDVIWQHKAREVHGRFATVTQGRI